MSATALEAREPSAKYLVMREAQLVQHFDLLATAPGGVARLRELIYSLAAQGQLVESNEQITLSRLDSVAEFVMGQAPPGNECNVDGAGTIFVKTGEFGEFHPVVREWTTKPLKLARAGDVLICVVGATIGKLNLAIDCAIGRSVAAIRPASSVLTKYLYFALMPFTLSLRRTARGSAQGVIGRADLGQVPLRIPSVAEQSRIVTRVEELMRLCDALEAKGRLEAAQHSQLVTTLLGTLTDSESPEALADRWQRIAAHFDILLDRPEAVDALEQTILQLAVRGLLVPQDPDDEVPRARLEEIRHSKVQSVAKAKVKLVVSVPAPRGFDELFPLPTGWNWVHVGEVVNMLNGYAFKSEWFKPSGIRLLRNLNIAHSQVDWAHSAFVDPNLADDFEQFALREGDVVLSLDRPIISTGLKFAVLMPSDLPCLLLQRVAKLAPAASVLSPAFLVLWLQSDLFRGTIDPGRSNGVPHISTKQVSALTLGLPPLAEQSRIVARVEELRRLCADLRERLAAGQRTQALLAEALVQTAAL
jgi:type I restriction enzyme, S subunit